MSLIEHHLTDTDLKPYLSLTSTLDDRHRVAALIRQQAHPENGWPRLIHNLESYERLQRKVVNVSGVDVLVTLNETRIPSIMANSFVNPKNLNQHCFLCHLDNEQKGILTLGRRYIILVNPGITVPGDLTIVSVDHDPQLVAGSFDDMLSLSKLLDNYSIFFNGAMAGASSPHLHFQAGLKNTLIAERQIDEILNGSSFGNVEPDILYQGKSATIYILQHFLRALYLIVSDDADMLKQMFKKYCAALAEVDRQIKKIPNVPDFGTRIASMSIEETEPRMNLMLKFEPSTQDYLLAIFPKLFNRPQAYFQTGNERLLLGMAIKESLGNLICCRPSDYQKLLYTPDLIADLYRDTSINKTMTDDLNRELMQKTAAWCDSA